MKIEHQANKIINDYLNLTKDLSLAKSCALKSIELIMENCKSNKLNYWVAVKKEISEYQIIFHDLRKYSKDNMPI